MNDNLEKMPAMDLPDVHLLDSLADGAYVTDTDRRILFWNKAAERITGWTAGEVVGRNCRDNILVHVDKHGNALCGKDRCPLHRCMVSEAPCDRPMLIYAQTSHGKRIAVEVTVAPLHDASGRLVGGIELFRDATREQDSLERALLIQRSLMTSNVHDPRVDVETLCAEQEVVGGDFCRVEQCGSSGVAVFIADVPGHGMSASFFTMFLRILWGEARDVWSNPAAVLDRLNHRVMPFAGEGGFFATAIAAYFDLEGDKLRLARAGHPAPFLFNNRLTKVSINPQLAIGMLENMNYANTELLWKPGDVALFFTDGAFEVYNRQSVALGLEGLFETVQAVRRDSEGDIPLEKLEQRLIGQSTCARLCDDMTFVKIRRI